MAGTSFMAIGCLAVSWEETTDRNVSRLIDRAERMSHQDHGAISQVIVMARYTVEPVVYLP